VDVADDLTIFLYAGGSERLALVESRVTDEETPLGAG
jgi:hypothetical protein